DEPLHCPLKVGILIPSSLPTYGGAYEFEHTVFAEALKRYYHRRSQSIKLIPIAYDAADIKVWNIDPTRCLILNPKLIKNENFLLSRIEQKVSKLAGHFFGQPVGKQLSDGANYIDILRSNIDILWSSNPNILTTQIPFIITIWDLQHRLQPFFPEVSELGEWSWIGRQEHYMNVATKAFCCVVGTKRGSSELTQFFGVDPSRIIVNPFPCPEPLIVEGFEDHSILSRFNVASQKFLLYPAQFWSHKNHVNALYALKILISSGSDLKLVLPGSDKGTLQSIHSMACRLGISEFVIAPGFLPREELVALYRNCLALIFPSFFGPDNIPPLEAMSYGVPAIVAKVPGSYEQYGNSVLYFDPCKPEDLAINIQAIMTDHDLRDELVVRGKALLLRLSPAAYLDRIESLLLQHRVALECCTLAR
ncbi:glycosyltransferase family 4 protein, partial [Cyanobium sp. BA5m-21]